MAATAFRARIAVLGCGAVGSAFARELLRARPTPLEGRLGLWSRSTASVARLRNTLAARDRGRIERRTEPFEALDPSALLLLCVAEPALEEVARALGRAPRRAAPVVLVASGSAPLGPLSFLRRRGFALGRLHPLVPVPRGGAARLAGLPFGVEGDARARRAAEALVAVLGGLPLRLRGRASDARAYHAGAALLGGGLVALLDLAARAMAPALRARPAELRRALALFAARGLDNVERLGPARALTGPVARGAEDTVRGHLAALAHTRHAAEAYRVLGAVMLDLARARGSLDAAGERRLRALLGRRTTHR